MKLRIFILVFLTLGLPAEIAAQQDNRSAERTDKLAVEGYMERMGLDRVLAAHLERELREAPLGQKESVGRRLSAVYLRLLESPRSASERASIEAEARRLIDAMPSAESGQLRIALARAGYEQAENTAERFRLQLASPEEVSLARETLSSCLTGFTAAASDAHRRVEALERREARVDDLDERDRLVLDDARRTRSLGMYYSGWARYYLALLDADPREAGEASEDFGWLLSAERGSRPTVDRVPESNLRFEHVQRAAIGVALAESLAGEPVRALRWLDMVESIEEKSPVIAAQLRSRRFTILIEHARWNEIGFYTDRAGAEDLPLDVTEARLLSVAALDLLDTRPNDEIAGRVARSAVSALVEAGQADQVVDLVRRYGSVPLGGDGFIVRYVRGLAASERAEAIASRGDDSSASARTAHAEAARAYESALAASDASRFPRERDKCRLALGLALRAAQRFEAAADALWPLAAAEQTQVREAAVWAAIDALDEAAQAETDAERAAELQSKRSRYAVAYIRSFPTSDRAAQLLLTAGRDAFEDVDQEIDLLLAVEVSSPLYPPSRQRAAVLLYQAYRSAAGSERTELIRRFIEVAEEVVASESARAQLAEDPVPHAERVRVLSLQVAQAALDAPIPDTDRAIAALDRLERVAAQLRLDLGPSRGPIGLLMARAVAIEGGTADEILRIARGLDGPWSARASRAAYKELAERLMVRPRDEELARRLVESEPGEPGRSGIADTVSAAAFDLWRSADDTAMRDTALAYDTEALELGTATPSQARRLALLAESAGRRELALRAWLTLVASGGPPSEEWYEARVRSIELLVELDPSRALAAIAQHRAMTAGADPEPWRERMQAAERAAGYEGGG